MFQKLAKYEKKISRLFLNLIFRLNLSTRMPGSFVSTTRLPAMTMESILSVISVSKATIGF